MDEHAACELLMVVLDAKYDFWTPEHPVVQLRERTGTYKNGKPKVSVRGTWAWAPCDLCGVGTFVALNDLKAQCQRCKHVPGSHPGLGACTTEGKRKGEVDRTACACTAYAGDPAPGRPCRMTPACGGKHRYKGDG